VDTGDNSGVSLTSPFVRENGLVRSAPKTLPSFGAGVGGGSVQLVARLQELRIGSLRFPQPVAHLSKAKAGDESKSDHAGQIGGEILRRVRAVFDYPHQRLILEKNAQFDQPFENDMGGIWIVTEAKDFHLFRVMNVLKGSPGEKAGLRVGDVITAIDGTPAAELTVDTIRQMFRQEGREYVLSVQRGKDTRTIRVRPRRLI
jgi:C-terminal processing protease CtpA/Prc